MNTWTQDEAIAFEAARECITDMIAICTEAIELERRRAGADSPRVEQLEAERRRLGDELRELRLQDQVAVQRVLNDYGPKLRADLAAARAKAA